MSATSVFQVIASVAKQSLPEKEIASSPLAPRNDTGFLVFRHAFGECFSKRGFYLCALLRLA
jgi:hypothetical protein